jgi:hypothetical protein
MSKTNTFSMEYLNNYFDVGVNKNKNKWRKERDIFLKKYKFIQH